MTISLSMTEPSQRSRFSSDHQLHFDTGDGRHCIVVSGLARVEFGGTGPEWKKEDYSLQVRIPSPPSGKVFKLERWVPVVTVNSVQNEDHAVDSGHAVTRFTLDIPASRILEIPYIRFVGDVAARDVDQHLTSVAYHATLLGRYIEDDAAFLV